MNDVFSRYAAKGAMALLLGLVVAVPATFAFSYRIVGRPAWSTELRLPLVATERMPQNERSLRAQTIGRDAREASRPINAGFVPEAPQFAIPKHPHIRPH